MRQSNRRKGGFSLVEVIVAITVLALVVTAVTSSLTASIQFNGRAERRLQAELAVSNAVERLRAEGFDGDVETDALRITGTEIKTNNENPDNRKTVGYTVTVTSKTDESVAASTFVRAKEATP